MRTRSAHLPLDSWPAHVGSAQLDGGSLSLHSKQYAGVGALVGASVGKAAGSISASVSHGSSGAGVGAEVGALVGALVGAIVGISTSVGQGTSHGTQMPQVASQKPSARLMRSAQWPPESCSAQVGAPQVEGGIASPQRSSQEGVGALVGAMVGAIVGALVGAAVGSSVSQGSSHGLQMPHVAIQ